ncbi:hypothetical protein AUJ65_04570 [Candidatus Micrarchaeota archaeon CG1_02_51_15]|nr:MAG: hypothetical protein AUJ65_04570 [Candidatus Micrarchaeota archaeon CG1_02_51_15]
MNAGRKILLRSPGQMKIQLKKFVVEESLSRATKSMPHAEIIVKRGSEKQASKLIMHFIKRGKQVKAAKLVEKALEAKTIDEGNAGAFFKACRENAVEVKAIA